MHYYQFNIGDYASHTKGLTLIEDLAYRRLIDEYYLSERPLNGCSTDVARMIGFAEHESAVEYVLERYFVNKCGSWAHDRIDSDIKAYQNKIEKASLAGKASAESRANAKKLTDVQQTLNDRSTNVQPTNNQEPLTKLTSKTLVVSELTPCPHSEIIESYSRNLPELPQVRKWEGSRASNLKARWLWVLADLKAKGKPFDKAAGIGFFERMFGYIAKSDFLMGRTDKAFCCSLAWICKDENFTKIIEGNYENKRRGAA